MSPRSLVQVVLTAPLLPAQRKSFDISYIGGSVSGTIHTQSVTIGTTKISNQALGAATNVDNEALSSMNVSGILGLSLPANSVIQSTLIGDSVGNALNNSASNTGDVLAGLWASSQVGERLFSIGLQRLPSDGGGRSANSSIAIGGVDPAYVPNSSASVTYTQTLPDNNGFAHHWKVYVSEISATVDGVVSNIPASFVGQKAVYPTAILDSAAPLSYAPASLLNAMYGAFVNPATNQRIGPGENGVYYVPCTLPLNLTLTVGGFRVPLHPLDASLSQATGDTSGSQSSACIGSFQAVTEGSPADADIVLGAPFIRSAYSVFSCDGNSSAYGTGVCSPQVLLLPLLTNSTQAFEEFTQVRVYGQPLGSNSAYGINSETSINNSSGLSAGAKIAIGIIAAIVALLAIFGLVAWFARRRAAAMRCRQGDSVGYIGGEKDSREDETDFGSAAGTSPVGAAVLSAKEQAQLREAALLHGYFDEDLVGSNGERDTRLRGNGSAGPGASVEPQWDVSSQGYVDARRVKHEYIERHPSLIELQETTTRSRMGQPEAITVHDCASDEGHDAYADASETVQTRRQNSTTSSRRDLIDSTPSFA